MKITIESTTKLITLMVDGKPLPARIWEGQTESGIPVHCYVTRLAPTIDRNDSRQSEFQRELKEQCAPSAAIEAIPMRMIL